MMERPQARIIDEQHVESEREILGYEAEQLLRKYGYQPQQMSSINQQPIEQPGLTFEEMVRQAEEKEINDRLRKEQQMYGPKPTTFDGRNGYDSEVKYSSDEDTGFSFKIEITSDMKIPRY
jgi:hypothetical protein